MKKIISTLIFVSIIQFSYSQEKKYLGLKRDSLIQIFKTNKTEIVKLEQETDSSIIVKKDSYSSTYLFDKENLCNRILIFPEGVERMRELFFYYEKEYGNPVDIIGIPTWRIGNNELIMLSDKKLGLFFSWKIKTNDL